MKKCLLIVVLLTICASSFAQKVNYGVKVGLNLAKQSVNAPGLSFTSQFLTAYNLGGVVNIDYNNLTIQTGLFLTTKGERFTSTLIDENQNPSGTTTSKYILTYLELPVNVFYKSSLTSGVDLHLGGGPYIGYGVAAKVSKDGVDYHGSFGNNPNDYVYYKNPDYGINFIAGTTFQNKYMFDVQYGLGLANITYGGNLKNRVISFSIGYLFK